MTLTEFLLARIAEDEVVAKAVVSRARGCGQAWHAVHIDYEGISLSPDPPDGEITHADDDTDHMTRWNTARVLAECEAKRRIVERFQRIKAESDATGHTGMYEQVWAARQPLFDLAAIYAEHPDYDDEWKVNQWA